MLHTTGISISRDVTRRRTSKWLFLRTTSTRTHILLSGRLSSETPAPQEQPSEPAPVIPSASPTPVVVKEEPVPDLFTREPLLGRRTTAAERLARLQKDTRIKTLEAHRAECGLCGKWIKLQNKTEYDPHNWTTHITKCAIRKK